MALSYGLNRAANQQPEAITVGVLATTTNDVELRVDTTKGLTHDDVILILEAFTRRLLDKSNSDLASV